MRVEATRASRNPHSALTIDPVTSETMIAFMLGFVIFVFLFVPAVLRMLGWVGAGVVVTAAAADALSKQKQRSAPVPPELRPPQGMEETHYERVTRLRREREGQS